MAHLADHSLLRGYSRLKRFPDALLRYLAAVALLLFFWATAYVLQALFGRGVSFLFSIFYLFVVGGSAWLGYGPGVLVALLVNFVAWPVLSHHAFQGSSNEWIRLVTVILVSLLISRIGRLIGRRHDELLLAARELERRVQLRTEEALRSADEKREAEHSQQEKAQLLDLARDAIFSLDFDGTVRFWNSGAERLYGWTRDEVIGKRAHELLQTIFPEALTEIEIQLVTRGHWEGEVVHMRRDGTPLRMMSRWALRKGDEGRPAGILEINSDITEKRRIEEQLQHTQKLESLGVLAGGVAHDFNNLLTGILGNASLAHDALPGTHPNRDLLAEVMKAAERAADLTRQMLAYAGKGRFVMKTLDLSKLVSEISGLIQTSIPKYVQVRHALADGLPGIDADPGQLQQIVMNLVINAAEAIGPDGGSVLVRTGVQHVDENSVGKMSSTGEVLRPGDYVLLEVVDTGSGMSPETLARIFDPFFTTKFAGRGLGLSAVLGIVRSHHGAMKVVSTPGKGTSFRVLFPASVNRLETVAPVQAGSLSGSGTVLVVDDEEIVRQTAAHTLQRYGYRTMAAEDGSRAIEIYKREPQRISLVLLDLTMPGVSGEEALRQLQGINAEVRVLLSSGYNEMEAVQRFAGKGLAGFIQKPYTAAALAEMVKHALTG